MLIQRNTDRHIWKNIYRDPHLTVEGFKCQKCGWVVTRRWNFGEPEAYGCIVDSLREAMRYGSAFDTRPGMVLPASKYVDLAKLRAKWERHD